MSYGGYKFVLVTNFEVQLVVDMMKKNVFKYFIFELTCVGSCSTRLSVIKHCLKNVFKVNYRDNIDNTAEQRHSRSFWCFNC